MARIHKLIAAILSMAALSAHAHHSGAMFNSAKTIHVQGTLKAVRWTSPHSWVSIIGSVDGKGKPEQWDVESVLPTMLIRMGLTHETLKPGEKITLAIHPLRDGRRGGSLISVTFADGRTVTVASAGGTLTPPKPQP